MGSKPQERLGIRGTMSTAVGFHNGNTNMYAASLAYAGGSAVLRGPALGAASVSTSANVQGPSPVANVLPASGTQPVQPSECETCANRKYQDVSDDIGVSFKTPAKISPDVAAATVMAHEMEHVAEAHSKAEQEGSRVMTSVALHTSICPDCGRVYVSGGTTRVVTMSGAEEEALPPVTIEEDGGADLFRKIYKQTMGAAAGLFMDVRT